VNLDTISNEMAGESTYTIEFWVKMDIDAQNDNTPGLFSINQNLLAIQILNGPGPNYGKLFIQTGNNTSNTDINNFYTDVNIADNICHHIAFVANGRNSSLYIDGVSTSVYSNPNLTIETNLVSFPSNLEVTLITV
jgi:hypothetical protein